MNSKDIGLKIAQVGYNAEDCADYQLAFNSAWPSLPIAFESNVYLPPDPGGTPVYKEVHHNLNFHPFTIAYVMQNGVFIGRSGNDFVNCLIGKNKLYLNNNDVSSGYTVNIRCYNIDITQQRDYTSPTPAGQKADYDPNNGIKLVKGDADIDSNDMRDFILHSRCQSPAILSVLTEKSAAPFPGGGSLSIITYTNPAGYLPWIYGFAKNVSLQTAELLYNIAYFAGGGSVGGLYYNNDSMSMAFSDKGSLVVLRDPLIGSSTIGVNY